MGIVFSKEQSDVIKGRKGSEQRILTGKGFQIEQDKKTYTAITDR